MKMLVAALVMSVSLLGYTIGGTEGRVGAIKEMAPASIADRGWRILRYEGYGRGSWGRHGGKVWYHVQNVGQEDIQYRVFITLWGGELHYHYNAPEKLQRINLNSINLNVE